MIDCLAFQTIIRQAFGRPTNKKAQKMTAGVINTLCMSRPAGRQGDSKHMALTDQPVDDDWADF